jgi:NhaA family Na+:H+ antiporter
VSGVGFTVSLLIAELAFEPDTDVLDMSKAGVLFGSVVAAALGAAILRTRDRAYRRAEQAAS